MPHGDMSSFEPLLEERLNSRTPPGVGQDSNLFSTGALLFPDLASSPVAWLDGHDGSDPRAFTRAAVATISAVMVGPTDSPEATGPIPAAFTYFGQFVFHDMVFSRVFGLPKDSGFHVRNAVSQGLDLTGLYGRGPQVDGHLFDLPDPGEGAPCRFPIGLTCIKNAEGERVPDQGGRDLPRLEMSGNFLHVQGRRTPYRPLVADPRNDDNLILSQLQATLMDAHNRLVDVQTQHRMMSSGEAYGKARELLIASYRHVVVHDYLRRILDPEIWHYFFGEGGGGMSALHELSGLPLEFTFGASRFAHSMVRQFYAVNDRFIDQPGTLDKVLSFSSLRSDGDVPVESKWMVDWKHFVDLNGEAQRARRLGPFFASALSSSNLAVDLGGAPQSVAFMDIWRCYELGLPSGQDVAAAVGARTGLEFEILSGERVLPTPAGRARFRYHADKLARAIEAVPSFMVSTPLSYYVLQEAAALGDDGSRLGPVGSFIVGATVAAALHRTSDTNFIRNAGGVAVKPNTLADILALSDRTLNSDDTLLELLDNRLNHQDRGMTVHGTF